MTSDRTPRYDAVVVGAGPNGLSAAIELTEHGWRVLVVEAGETVGGGARSAELTLPGFIHDVCSAVHPLALMSPAFRRLPLERFGVEFVQPAIPLAHPLDDGTAVELHRSIELTAAGLGADGDAWRQLIMPLVDTSDAIVADALGPIRLPAHPIALARFGAAAIRSATGLAERRFGGDRARALFAGLAAHGMVPLESPATAAFGLVLGLSSHAVGWPVIRGGSQRLVDGLAAYLRAIGGEIVTGWRVTSLHDLPDARVTLFDTSPRALLDIAGDHLPASYRAQLRRFRSGMGAFKVDYALAEPVPWTADACRESGTVHLGGTIAEIAEAERATAHGDHPDRPFVLVAQQSLADSSRAPNGQHTLWTYCHVPRGSTVDMTERIERQIERFAPGFCDRILARHVMTTTDFERYNSNYIGGDINGGMQNLRQVFTRPVPRLDPYATPNPRLFLCSASTPPGGGVHGLCGYYAAKSVLRRSRERL
jgi:phytoene dehydrogenase-like protein